MDGWRGPASARASYTADLIMVGRRFPLRGQRLLLPPDGRRLWGGLALGIALPVIVTPLATASFQQRLSGLPYVLAVVVATLLGRLLGGLVATVLSATLINYYVLPPTHAFKLGSFGELVPVIVFLAIALVVTQLLASFEVATADARSEQRRLSLLAKVSDTLGGSVDHDRALKDMARLVVPELADWCSVDLMDGSDRVEHIAVAHSDPAKVATAEEWRRQYPPDPHALTGVPQVVRTGRSELHSKIGQELLAQAPPAQQELVRSLGMTSAMLIPLTARGRTFGVLTLVSAESGVHYDEGDLRLAEQIAERAALAIDNARLFQAESEARSEAERSASRTELLQSLTALLAGAIRPEDVANVLLREALQALGGDGAVVAMLEPDARTVSVMDSFGYERGDEVYWNRFSIDDDLPLADAMRTRTTVVLGSVRQRNKRYRALEGRGQPNDHALACVPVMLESEVLGGIAIRFPEARELSPVDVELLEALADQCAQAFDRARLHRGEREARQRLGVLSDISRALAVSLDYRQTLQRATELATRYLGDSAIVFLVDDGHVSGAAAAPRDPDKGAMVERVLETYRPALSDAGSDVARALRTGETQVLRPADLAYFDSRTEWHGIAAELQALRPRSGLVVPLVLGGRIIGALALANTDADRTYSPDDVQMAEEVGRRMARAIENARLYRERDHIAGTLQKSLLPPRLPAIPGLEVAAYFSPARYEIGGDFYDVFELDHDAWRLVIGDVCGKGPEAAVLTGLARHTIRACGRELDPASVLLKLNDSLLREDLADRFCTVCVVHATLTDGAIRLEVASGGHPLPLIVGSDGTFRFVGKEGTLLGVLETPPLQTVIDRLEPHETLIMYTDGLLGRAADPLAPDSPVRRLLHSAAGMGPSEVAATLDKHVADLPLGDLRDDVAVLIAAVACPPPLRDPV